MARQSKLTPEQWAIAKARWEGSPTPGFEWLSREIEAAWGVTVLRKSLDQMAKLKGWEKVEGGPPSEPIPAAPNARRTIESAIRIAQRAAQHLELVVAADQRQLGARLRLARAHLLAHLVDEDGDRLALHGERAGGFGREQRARLREHRRVREEDAVRRLGHDACGGVRRIAHGRVRRPLRRAGNHHPLRVHP